MSYLLVVDDSLSVRNAIREVLAPMGFGLELVATGRAGVAAAQVRRPDLVICDLVLPDIDGFEVFAEIRAVEALQSVPFLFISGMVDREIEERAQSLGACPLIKKPFSPEALLASTFASVSRPRSDGAKVVRLSSREEAAHPAPAVEVAPRRTRFDRYPEVLQKARTLAGLLFVALIAPDGTVLGYEVGPAAERGEIAPLRVDELLRLATSVDTAVRSGAVDSLVLEASDAILLIDSLPTGEILVVCTSASILLGMSRLHRHKLSQGLRQAASEGDSDHG